MDERALTWVSLLLALSPSAFATEATTTVDESAIHNFEQLGRAMYEQDIRAARATDLVVDGHGLPQGLPPGLSPTGWIVDADGDDRVVRFVGEVDGAARSFADVRFEGQKDGVVTLHPPVPLNADELAQYKARQLVSRDLNAMATVGQLCVPRFNLISLPKADHSGIYVWAIAANTNPNQVQVGGHFRYVISDSGEKLLTKDQLYKSCLVMDNSSARLPNGAKPVALVMSWIVSDTPLEIHVFLQLYAHMPFKIGTVGNNSVWSVEDGHISRVDTLR